MSTGRMAHITTIPRIIFRPTWQIAVAMVHAGCYLAMMSPDPLKLITDRQQQVAAEINDCSQRAAKLQAELRRLAEARETIEALMRSN